MDGWKKNSESTYYLKIRIELKNGERFASL